MNIPGLGVVEVPDDFGEDQISALSTEIGGGTPQAQPTEIGVTRLPPEQPQPQQALGEGLTFAGGGAETPSALFPRTAEAVGQQKGFLKETGAAGLDLLSLLGRSIASTPELFSDEEKSFVTDLSKTEGTGGFEDILRSPATGAAVLAAPLGGAIAGAKFGAQALTGLGRTLATGAKLGAAGATESVIAAGTGVGERAVKGEDLGLGQAFFETAIGTAVPILGGVGAAGVKKAIVKPAQDFFIDLAEEAGKISEETIRTMATRKGSKALKDIRLNERAALDLGENVTDLISNFPRFNTAENKAIKKTLSRMGKIDLNPVVAKIDDLKIKSRAGREVLGEADEVVNKELDKISLELSSGDALVSAENAYLDRVDLDKNIRWDKLTRDFPKAAGELEKKLVTLRTSMQNTLKSKAKETGNEQFISTMESLSKKLTVRDKVIKNIGRNKEAFVNNLQGKNKTEFKENLLELDNLFGMGFAEKSKLIRAASELNKRGKLPLTGREGIKAILGSPRAISAGVGLSDASLRAPTSTLGRVGIGVPAREIVGNNMQSLEDLAGGQ